MVITLKNLDVLDIFTDEQTAI